MDAETVYKRLSEITARFDEGLSRRQPLTAGAEAYQSLAALRDDLHRSIVDGREDEGDPEEVRLVIVPYRVALDDFLAAVPPGGKVTFEAPPA